MPLIFTKAKNGFAELVKGDTLKAGRMPQYRKGEHAPRPPWVTEGTDLQVTEVYPAGVQVQNKAGEKMDYYFEHGAAKLDLTKDTAAAIAKRANFKSETEAGEATEEAGNDAMKKEIADLRDALNQLKALGAKNPPAGPGNGSGNK